VNFVVNFVNYDLLYTNELVNYQMLMNLHFHVNHHVGLLDLEFPWEGLHLLKLWWWVETLLQDFQVFPFFKT
jgi:hypothetical protein